MVCCCSGYGRDRAYAVVEGVFTGVGSYLDWLERWDAVDWGGAGGIVTCSMGTWWPASLVAPYWL
jgi:hypothetical protein